MCLINCAITETRSHLETCEEYVVSTSAYIPVESFGGPNSWLLHSQLGHQSQVSSQILLFCLEDPPFQASKHETLLNGCHLRREKVNQVSSVNMDSI